MNENQPKKKPKLNNYVVLISSVNTERTRECEEKFIVLDRKSSTAAIHHVISRIPKGFHIYSIRAELCSDTIVK
ncbi:hypothetical protein [Thalassotalea hakodatensis]|uniref:hypothetical protein n=1 Tax=Thalassotalea hakodatensis TaxID=3030492 RepID=UPI002573A4B8|nr:hypothetical protein [Thalassotalea hakodatensis]